MALSRKLDLGQAFKSDNKLQQFVLTDVSPTGKILGAGSYGSVEEVSYKHLVCAGKRLHEALIDVENEGVAEVVQKYLQECQLMSSLCHPNITQFLGLCFLPGTQLPVLVMERLETSLDNLLEHMPNLPLSLKRSLLEDIARGLLYLHDRQPPIIHRDLTSKNVLLTSSLVAKITDMGNSRIVTMRPAQLAKTLTKYPGTLVYMPPEAQDNIHRYGTAMDVFSFGHLALYTVTQRFPGDILPSTYISNHEVRARTELERREVYVKLLESCFSLLTPSLVELVKQCLHNDPSERPSTEQLLTTLQEMRGQVEGECSGCEPIRLDMVRLRLMRECKEKDRKIQELTQELSQLQVRHDMDLENVRRNLDEISSKLEQSQISEALLRKDLEIQKVKLKEKLQEYLASLTRQTCDGIQVDRRQISLIMRLGEEESVEVWEGRWNGIVPVAIKIFKQAAGNATIASKECQQEISIMNRCCHPNIIRLYGVCTEKNPVYLVTEVSRFGPLLNFLQKGEGQSLLLPQLIDLCIQIAGGMSYLESLNCINRNLVTEMVFVSESLICKIGDFSKSVIHDDGSYEDHSDAKFAFKCTAIEALLHRLFSSKSDVWSFGIVLFEVITYGQTPYAEIANSDLLPALLRGYRLPKPDSCPDKLYEMMLNCWQEKPELRPSFQTLQAQLEGFFSAK